MIEQLAGISGVAESRPYFELETEYAGLRLPQFSAMLYESLEVVGTVRG